MEPDRKWLVNRIATDFTLLDLWEIPLPISGDCPNDINTILSIVHKKNDKDGLMDYLSSFLFWFRKKLGAWFNLDRELNTLPIPGCREISLKERLKALDPIPEYENTLNESFLDLDDDLVAFKTVYRLENERLMELSNNTVHGLMHYGMVKQSDKQILLVLSVYIKTRGALGRFYMKLINPFRHLIVYPTLTRNVKKNWERYNRTKAGS